MCDAVNLHLFGDGSWDAVHTAQVAEHWRPELVPSAGGGNLVSLRLPWTGHVPAARRASSSSVRVASQAGFRVFASSVLGWEGDTRVLA